MENNTKRMYTYVIRLERMIVVRVLVTSRAGELEENGIMGDQRCSGFLKLLKGSWVLKIIVSVLLLRMLEYSKWLYV